jgi:hypothetical protein
VQTRADGGGRGASTQGAAGPTAKAGATPTTAAAPGANPGAPADPAAAAAQSGDFTILLRDSGGTLLASKAIDGDAHQGSSAVYERYPLDTEVTLAAGDVVRLTKRPDSASNTSVCEFTCPSGLSAALPGGGAMVYTSRTDAGAWTDTADKVAAIGLILSALSDNTGGARPRARGWVG